MTTNKCNYNAETTQSELCKNYKMSKVVISRLINKYKTKGTVETEHLDGLLKKSAPHTDRKIIRYAKRIPFVSARNTQIGTRYFRKYSDVWMMQGCIVILQKNHSYR